MDNSFEKEFLSSIANTDDAAKPSQTESRQENNNSPKSNKPFLQIIIILSTALLIETITLIITIVNLFSSFSTPEDSETGISEEVTFEDDNFKYDTKDNLIAVNLVCTSEDSRTIVFYETNSYSEYDSSRNHISDGTYSIINSNLFSLIPKDGQRDNTVLYYDGINVADKLTLYNCEEGSVGRDN